MGSKNGFLTVRLKNYSTDRNNPLKPQALSGLSPYLHFGQMSAQRCAVEASKVRKLYTQVVEPYPSIYVCAIILLTMKCFLQSIELVANYLPPVVVHFVPGRNCGGKGKKIGHFASHR